MARKKVKFTTETALGEPQAWIELKNGRSIEITHEEDGLEEEECFFSVRLHCSGQEYENGEYRCTMGIIDQYTTFDENEVCELVKRAKRCNESYPITR